MRSGGRRPPPPTIVHFPTAEQTKDAECKRLLMGVAATYTELARRAIAADADRFRAMVTGRQADRQMARYASSYVRFRTELFVDT